MPRQCRMSASSGSPKTTGICCDEMSRTSRRSRDAALVMSEPEPPSAGSPAQRSEIGCVQVFWYFALVTRFLLDLEDWLLATAHFGFPLYFPLESVALAPSGERFASAGERTIAPLA